MMSPYLKALYGAVIAGLGATQAAYVAHSAITWGDGVTIAVVTVSALAVIWAVPNESKPKP